MCLFFCFKKSYEIIHPNILKSNFSTQHQLSCCEGKIFLLQGGTVNRKLLQDLYADICTKYRTSRWLYFFFSLVEHNLQNAFHYNLLCDGFSGSKPESIQVWGVFVGGYTNDLDRTTGLGTGRCSLNFI